MAEIDFGQILTSDFPWPKKSDTPFQASKRWDEDALIEPDSHGRMVMMITGYKAGADVMVQRAMAYQPERDALVFPIIFNYRQYLELSLKYLISTYGPKVGVQADWKNHSLMSLWHRYEKVLEGYGGEGDPDNTAAVVRRIVGEFAKVDPKSFSYRYPVDTEGEPIKLTQERLDLTVLARVMAGVEGYFSGCDGYLDNLMGAGP